MFKTNKEICKITTFVDYFNQLMFKMKKKPSNCFVVLWCLSPIKILTNENDA